MDQDSLVCPKCGAANRPRVYHIEIVVDKLGRICLCSCCAYTWDCAPLAGPVLVRPVPSAADGGAGA